MTLSSRKYSKSICSSHMYKFIIFVDHFYQRMHVFLWTNNIQYLAFVNNILYYIKYIYIYIIYLQREGQHHVRLGQDVSLISHVQEGVVHGGAFELLFEVRTSFGHRQTLQVRHQQVD